MGFLLLASFVDFFRRVVKSESGWITAAILGGSALAGAVMKRKREKKARAAAEAHQKKLANIASKRARWSGITGDNSWSDMAAEAAKPLPDTSGAFLRGGLEGAQTGMGLMSGIQGMREQGAQMDYNKASRENKLAMQDQKQQMMGNIISQQQAGAPTAQGAMPTQQGAMPGSGSNQEALMKKMKLLEMLGG